MQDKLTQSKSMQHKLILVNVSCMVTINYALHPISFFYLQDYDLSSLQLGVCARIHTLRQFLLLPSRAQYTIDSHGPKNG